MQRWTADRTAPVFSNRKREGAELLYRRKNLRPLALLISQMNWGQFPEKLENFPKTYKKLVHPILSYRMGRVKIKFYCSIEGRREESTMDYIDKIQF